MQSTVGVIVLLAFGLGVVEALRAWLPGTGVGAMLAARIQGKRTSDRLQRFGEARTIASATAPPVIPFRSRDQMPASTRSQATAAAPDSILEGFTFAAAGSPSIVRIDSLRDMAQFARGASLGDLWLRLSDFDTWPARRERRDALIEAIAAQPELDDQAVYQAGVALAIWEDDGAYDVHRSRNRRRVQRLRSAASSDVVYLDDVRASRERADAAAGDGSENAVA